MFAWFFRDSILQNKWRALLVLGAGFLGVTFQLQVFGLIIYYSRHFSTGEMINILEYTINPRTSVTFLTIGSFAIFILLAMSSICIFFSKKNIMRMSRKYEEFCAKRVFHLLGVNIDYFVAIQEDNLGDSYLFRLVKSDSKMTARVLRMSMSLIIPLITLLFSLTILFYLEFVFSLIIAFLGSIFLFYQYKVNKLALEHSIKFEKLGPVASKEYRAIINHCKLQSHFDENRDLVESVFSKGPVQSQLDCYEGRILAMENSRFVSGIFIAVIIGLIILIMGGAIIREGSGWGRLLLYVVALRFAMLNLQATFTTLTAINRYYIQMRRIYTFLHAFVNKAIYQNVLTQEYIFKLKQKEASEVLKNASQQLKIDVGNALALITPLNLNRYTLADLLRGLLGDNNDAFNSIIYSTRFATSRHSCPCCSLRQLLNLPKSSRWGDLRLPEQTIIRLKKQLPQNLDKVINLNLWEQVDPEIKFALSLLSAIESDCQWIILEEKGLHLLDNESRSFFLSQLTDRITVIAFNKNLRRVGNYSEVGVAVMNQTSLIGLGSPDWFKTVSKSVQEILFFFNDKHEFGSNDTDDEAEFDEI